VKLARTAGRTAGKVVPAAEKAAIVAGRRVGRQDGSRSVAGARSRGRIKPREEALARRQVAQAAERVQRSLEEGGTARRSCGLPWPRRAAGDGAAEATPRRVSAGRFIRAAIALRSLGPAAHQEGFVVRVACFPRAAVSRRRQRPLSSPSPLRSSARGRSRDKAVVLSVTQGPRGGDWKREFNPFPATTPTPLAGHRRQSTSRCSCTSRANASYVPGSRTCRTSGVPTTSRSGSRSARASRGPTGQPFSGKDRRLHVRPDAALRRARPPQGVWRLTSPNVKSADAGSVEFTFKRAYTPGPARDRHAADRVSEHKWKDVAQPASFDDPSPVGTGPMSRRSATSRPTCTRSAATRSTGRRTSRPSSALARADLPHERRDHAAAL
jgi:hypothetical protein